ncbi:hypothetical protein K474DRAFT_615896 [Panus rudis PR-1116 ss-1]|nr:hypothetical protein K474DRAFT_615896 [Panus rudis PR-1116 ss-1]
MNSQMVSPYIGIHSRGFLDMCSLVQLLVNVKVVNFQHEMSSKHAVSQLPPSLNQPLIPTLIFYKCHDSVVSLMVPIFPRAKQLVLDSAIGRTPILQTTEAALSALKVKDLTFYASEYATLDSILQYLQRSSFMGSITSLDLDDSYDLLWREWRTFWKDIGTNLVHLRLTDETITGYEYHELGYMLHNWKDILPQLIHLLTFSIKMLEDVWVNDLGSTPSALETALSFIPSTTQVIVIESSTTSFCEVDTSRWKTLSAMLARFN